MVPQIERIYWAVGHIAMEGLADRRPVPLGTAVEQDVDRWLAVGLRGAKKNL